MAQAEVNLRDIYRIVRKRRWVVILAPILTALATFAISDAPEPIYNAEAMVRISRTSTVSALMTEIISYSAYDNMATQIMVVTSGPVLEEVAARMALVERGEDARLAAQALKGQVIAEQRNFSDILAVMATSSSEDGAIRLANTTAEVYIDQYDAERDRRIEDVVRFIEERLEEAAAALDEAELDVELFRRSNARILGLTAAVGNVDSREREMQYRQRLNDVTAARTRLTRIAADNDYDTLLETFIYVDEPGTAATIADLTQQAATLAELRSEWTDLLRFQVELAPQVVDLGQRIERLEGRLAAMLSSLIARVTRLESDYQELFGGLESQREDLLSQIEAEAELEQLEALVDEAQETATMLRGQFQDAQIQQRERVDEITIVERAHTATLLPQPDRGYKALVGALIGLLLGGLFAFVLESMDTSIGTIEDVEQYIGSPVVGVIPHLEGGDIEGNLKRDPLPDNVSDEDLARFARLTTHFDPRSVASEAYRTLRTNVRTALAAKNGKVLLVTSSMVQEGKTTTAVNLATAFAQTGKKTLLIDADLRRPNVDRIFGLDRSPGLSDLLLGTRNLAECTRTIDDLILGRYGLRLSQRTPGLEYLHVVPAGSPVDNPAELLQSSAFDELIKTGREKFDFVIVDVSPVMPVADGYVIAPRVDGVLLTYQIGRVARDVLHRTKQRMESLGVDIVGIVMNDIRAEIDYTQGNFQHYQYRYEPEAEPVGVLSRAGQRLRGIFSGRGGRTG